MAPIHDAIHAFDVAALRRELAAGVSPELNADADDSDSDDDPTTCTPLYLAVIYASAKPERMFKERVAMVATLLEAGASVNARSYNRTALHVAVSTEAFGDITDMLLAANADVNAPVDYDGRSVVASAALYGSAATVKKLISAGARDLDDALVAAVSVGRLRNCAPLLRAGAALPADDKTDEILRRYDNTPNNRNRLLIIRARTYIAKISGMPGGFKAYEREHRRRLTAVFANKFSALPVEVISHIVLLWAHCGDYDYQDYAWRRAEHWRMVSEQIAREREDDDSDDDIPLAHLRPRQRPSSLDSLDGSVVEIDLS